MLSVLEAANLLRSLDRVLILTHVRPDGDTVGCAAALCAGLRSLGKTAYLLPNPGLTDTTAPYFAPYAAPEEFVPDHVVSTDIATVGLFPDNALPYADRVELAIDHHPSFTHFGKANIVRPEAAACGELIYDLLAALGPITAEMALPLYVAVSTDTGCFMYGNTTPATHRVAAALMETGIDYQAANKRHFRTKSYKRFRLEALIVANMDLHDGGKLAVTAISLEDMARLGADERDAEDIAAFLGQLEGVETSVTIRELQPGECKLSVRTVDGGLNATRVCSLLGGGGHAAAAGCTVWGGVDDAKREILKAIRTVQHGG